MVSIEKIVVVTKKTWLEELIERFNTKSQARFYIEHMGGSFEDYEAAHNQYHKSLNQLKKAIPRNYKAQYIEKSFLPNFLFGPKDLVVVIGQDGLVINTSKYLENQLILGINPDPDRFDGVMLPFYVNHFQKVLEKTVDNEIEIVNVTMAVAKLNNKQQIFGVNDLFIGHKSHGSARYTIEHKGIKESQSSSGIIVSTGAGSSAWHRSIVTGAIAITNKFRSYDAYIDPPKEDEYRFPWNANYLKFSIREPFISKTSAANIVYDTLYAGDELIIESNMPENGVIFSDGIEKDFLKFNSGTIATITVAEKKVNLITKIY